MECLVIALASPLPCVDPGLGTNWFTGGGWWAGEMKSLFFFSVHLSWEDFHSKGFYIFRISRFCFNVVNNHFKPTIFSKGLIIQVGKLVLSHHLSFLAHQNIPCSWEWQFRPYLVRAMDKKNSIVGVQCEPSSGGPYLSILPLLFTGTLLLHTASMDGGWQGWVTAPLHGDCLPCPHRSCDQIFQNNTKVTGSLCVSYKYVRCWGTVVWAMRFLEFFNDAIYSFIFSLLLGGLSPKPCLGWSWASQRASWRSSRLMKVKMNLMQGGCW